jgi:uncharacterized circularly permuted ATP-grasp superfamily protein/uncharacterized alpha-E superfamily protein
VEPISDPSLFAADDGLNAADLAASLARRARQGHFDELRGSAQATSGEALAPHWQQFFEHLGKAGFDDLDRRARDLARQIRDNCVTYNVYADADGPQRPWSLDLFPLIIPPKDWARIESGVLQRTRLLDRIMADVYGPQRLLHEAVLPAALVQGHPGYLRPMHGTQAPGDTWLHIAAFDLARGPDGHWWVVSQRTQAPSGLGYLLENRLATSRLFPQAFEAMQVQRLAGTYRALMDHLRRLSPAGERAHIALLTPGPYNETYFEHAYLARYLGLTLVEGSDLTVRDERLYLKTLHGLQPVHGLLKRLDDEFLDPLELRPDSRLGVPGLLQVIRAGNVLVANAPGSAFLESPALLGFLPALAERLLDETLELPALPTWWCGEQAAWQQVLPDLADHVIKPTCPRGPGQSSFEPVHARHLGPRELDEWAGRIARQGEDYTVQAHMPLGQMPAWSARGADPGARIVPRSCMLRVFAVADGPQSWRVLPGGLVRMAAAHGEITSMQRGGSSADAWVLTPGAVDRTTLLPPHSKQPSALQRQRVVTSRSAENLYWLGRYTERAENSARLARVTLECLNGEDSPSQPVLAWLSKLAHLNALVLPGVPSATSARRVFERSLVASLADPQESVGVGHQLRAIKSAASALRERLSKEHWNVIVRAEAELAEACARRRAQGDFSPFAAMRSLEQLSTHLAAMTGAQTDRMTRDAGWLLLSAGRFVERLAFHSQAMAECLEAGAHLDNVGFDALVALFDSTITCRARYQQSRDPQALLDLLLWDLDNPRALAWVARTLGARLQRLAALTGMDAPSELSAQAPLAEQESPSTLHTVASALGALVPDPAQWGAALDEDGMADELVPQLQAAVSAAWHCSESISTRYFTHALAQGLGLGA